MPHTDENGRQLEAFINYVLDGKVSAKDIYEALGRASSSYYKRIQADDYPNPDELLLIARRFNFNPIDLQATFGWLTPEDIENAKGGGEQQQVTDPTRVATKAKAPPTEGRKRYLRLPRARLDVPHM